VHARVTLLALSFSENMFAGTVLLGFSLRPETYNALADI
jgi:hypothetical protein